MERIQKRFTPKNKIAGNFWCYLNCFLNAASVFYLILHVADGGVVFEKGGEQFHDHSLRLVHVVFRHGQRTPADTYPNDVYVNHSFSPFGWGQLTHVGKQNQYKLGEFLRSRYDDFLGDTYSASTVYAQSTRPDRANMSCAFTLAGLWPTKGASSDWSPDVYWSPIPISSEPLDEDTLLLARKNCPRYYEELNNVFRSDDVIEILQDNSLLFEELSEITGMPITSPDDVQSLYSTLKAEEDLGLKLPKWTENYYPYKLVELTEQSFILNAKNQELKRLKGGPLVKKLLHDWSAKAAGTIKPSDRKMFVYAGHDSTVSNLLLALNVWDQQIPTYGITAIFELYENTFTNEFGVEIFLRNSTLHEPTQLIIPGCSPRCPLKQLMSLTEDVVPHNWEQECKSKNPNFVAPAPSGP